MFVIAAGTLKQEVTMPFSWSVSWNEFADGSKLVKLTRTENGLSRRTRKTVSYRLAPGEQVPKYAYQFDRAWRHANESPARRQARQTRAAKLKETRGRRAAELKTAPRRRRVVTGMGCGVLGVMLLAAVGLVVAGFVVLSTNRCFFLQFPPAGCPVASVDPPGAALGWHLISGGIFGGSGVALLVLLVAAVARASRSE